MRLAFCCIGATVGSLLGMPVLAATYDPVLSFSTDARQGAFGPGEALRFAPDPVFIGPPAWNESITFGDIVGSQGASSIPNPARLAWSACRLIPFARCGSAPPSRLRIPFDTRTGAEAVIATSGRIGLEASFAIDAGSVAADVDFRALADVPSPGEVEIGKPFSLNTRTAFENGRLDAIGPGFEAALDVVATANLSASVQACLIAAGCREFQDTYLDFDERLELIGADARGIRYLDGFLPDLVSLETPLLDQVVSLEADLVSKKLDFSVTRTGNAAPDPDLSETVDGDNPVSSGVNIELANVEIKAPILDGEAFKAPTEDVVRLETQSEFLALNADIDGLLTYANVLPPLGVRVDILNALSATLDLLDVEAGPFIDVFQSFVLRPELLVDLSLSAPAIFEGIGVADSFAGRWEDLPAITLLEETTFDPMFSVAALLESETGLQFGAQVGLELLSGSADLSFGAINFFSGQIGPLIDEVARLDPRAARLGFGDTFMLGGFAPVAGPSFTLGSSIIVPSVAPIPLPAAVWMLLVAVGGLVAVGRGSVRAA